jgi:hypothetical protein
MGDFFQAFVKNLLKVDVDGTKPNTLKSQLYPNTKFEYNLSTGLDNERTTFEKSIYNKTISNFVSG